VNAVACLENTETSAVGRALANLGFTASRERASAEEMAKASRARARLAGREKPVAFAPSPDPASGRASEPDPLIADLLRLIGVAERAGLRSRRAEAWRAALARSVPPAAMLVDLERRLRGWLLRRLP
jgi:hypothetical protein